MTDAVCLTTMGEGVFGRKVGSAGGVAGANGALQSARRFCLAVKGKRKKKKRTLPLFIKPQQIQLACGLPSNPINLLSCESTQQLLPISHFSWRLIRSAGDIQWGSLQLHHRRYSCSKTAASHLIRLLFLFSSRFKPL